MDLHAATVLSFSGNFDELQEVAQRAASLMCDVTWTTLPLDGVLGQVDVRLGNLLRWPQHLEILQGVITGPTSG